MMGTISVGLYKYKHLHINMRICVCVYNPLAEGSLGAVWRAQRSSLRSGRGLERAGMAKEKAGKALSCKDFERSKMVLNSFGVFFFSS